MQNQASYSANDQTQKQRNVERACDNCRRKKSRCDGSRMPGNICSNCIQTRKSCTYVEPSKPRGPPKAYVSNLEDRLEALEYILEQIHPGVDFSDVLGPPVIRDSWKNEPPTRSKNRGSVKTLARPSLPNLVLSPPPSIRRSNSYIFPSATPLEQSTHLIFPSKKRHKLAKHHSSSSSRVVQSDDDEIHSSDSSDLSDWDYPLMEQNTFRFYGRSTPLRLIGMAKKLKKQHKEQRAIESADTMSDSDVNYADPENLSLHRPQFWRIPLWEGNEARRLIPDRQLLQDILIRFPPPDLAVKLWDLYFLHVNPQFPLLHRPTLDKQWKQRLHHENLWFACVCLSVFAVASRWCDDPRVLPKVGTDASQDSWTKAGWDFYDVAMYVHQVRQSFYGPATLFELQALSLLAMFVRGTSQHTVGWLLVGSGIRKAQDVGAHRKHQYSERPTVTGELWKRAFWLLVSFDRIGSAALGRNCGVGEEDFDLDLPTEVDDEYWEPSESRKAFTQPRNLPSQVTAFNLWVKLSQVIAFALRTIYSINNSQIFFGKFSLPNVEQIVAQLDAALEKWLKSVPSHLKWSSEIEDPIFANQSATIYTTYYLTQMLIYRPFIPRPRVSSSSAESTLPLGSSALRICTDAAKACVPIIKHQMRRGISNVPNLISVAHISAALLLINVWDLKGKESAGVEDMKPPIAQSIDLLMDDINVFLSALEWAQHRFEVVIPVLKSLRDSLPSSDEETNRQNAANFTQAQKFVAERRKQGFSRQPTPMTPKNCRPIEGWSTRSMSMASTAERSAPLLRQKSSIDCPGPKTEAKSYRVPPVSYVQHRPVTYPPPPHPPPPNQSQNDSWTTSQSYDYHYPRTWY